MPGLPMLWFERQYISQSLFGGSHVAVLLQKHVAQDQAGTKLARVCCDEFLKNLTCRCELTPCQMPASPQDVCFDFSARSLSQSVSSTFQLKPTSLCQIDIS